MLSAIRESKADLGLLLNAMRERRSESSQILQAIEDLRASAASPKVLLSSPSRLASNEPEVVGGIHPLDLSPVLEAVRDLRQQVDGLAKTRVADGAAGVASGTPRADVDLSPVLRALEAHTAALAEAIREAAGKTADLSPLMRAIEESRPSLDLAPVLHELRGKGEVDLSPILEAVREVKTSWDCTPVARAVEELRNALDLTPVLHAVRETKAAVDVDFAPVLTAINALRPELDVRPFLDALHDYEAAADNRAIYSALCASATAPSTEERVPCEDHSGIVRALCRQFSSGGSAASDLEPVLQAVQEGVARALKQVQEKETKVDFSPILRAIEDNLTHVDYGAIFSAINQGMSQVDFRPVIRAIQEADSEA